MGRSRAAGVRSAVMTVALAAIISSCGAGSNDSDRAAAVLDELAGAARIEPLGPDADEVKIGLYNLEGGDSVSLPVVADAQEAVIAYANDYLGGLAGRRIVAVRCGAGDDDESAEACARRFVAEDVVAVVSGQSARSAPVVGALEEAGIVYLGAALNDTAELGASDAYFIGPGFLGAAALWAETAVAAGHDGIGLLLAEVDGTTSIDPLLRSLFGGNDLAVTVATLDGPDSAAGAVADVLADDPGLVAVVADAPTCAAVYAALETERFAGDVTAVAPCIEESAVAGLSSASGIAPAVMVPFVTAGTGNEVRLYEAVLSRYGGVERSMFSASGYAVMVALLRLTGELGPTDELDARAVAEAVRESGPVPAPLGGDGAMLDCGSGTFGSPLVRSTVCSPMMYAATLRDGSVVTATLPLDANVPWERAFD